VKLGDDKVLIVARVAYEGRAVVHDVDAGPLPGEVVEVVLARHSRAYRLDLTDPHLRAVRLRIPLRRQAVDAVQLQECRANVVRLLPDTVQREWFEIVRGQL
jgi:hypothetical protein